MQVVMSWHTRTCTSHYSSFLLSKPPLFHDHFSINFIVVVISRWILLGRHEELSFVARGRWAAPVTFLEDAPVVERARAAAVLVRGLGRCRVDVVRVNVRLPQPRPIRKITTVINSCKNEKLDWYFFENWSGGLVSTNTNNKLTCLCNRFDLGRFD